MKGDQELQVIVQQGKELNPTVQDEINQTGVPHSNIYKRWLRVIAYTFFVISGQSVAAILGRVYYDNGGKSKWLATVVQLVGFPVLLPYYLLSIKTHATTHTDSKAASPRNRVLVYVALGVLVGAGCYLYSIGLLYLPVSTFSLICASQLAFNALFSYFLNSQKLTPIILNSLLLLTISSTLLAFNNEESNFKKVTRGQYVTSFICTIGASAGFGLVLSLQQVALRKVLKRQTFSEVMDLIIYVNLVASCVSLVGLFASGEWKTLSSEMDSYKLGKVSYAMNLVWTAISWQVFNVGGTGLIFELSSLFSNAISALGLPVVPVLAVIIFHDKMNGLKVISMILAIWGFMSYVYQHYLDDKNLKKSLGISTEESSAPSEAERSSGQRIQTSAS
ncbi:PREDICTED: probable purine permease 10 isoform X3 [Brassica oleracea var. oleracea]|uniref:probable purine permease 10 isoform X3 n=1 Tax=Brassica oleracea var. oleracea TaxID=109376 RepID=UPI0006A700C8|nr:PREDICTED: probable purine permease 10 isoform X3 [Brassica oleracea var. oleracea]